MREFPALPAQATGCFLHGASGGPREQITQLSLSLGETASAGRLRETWQALAARHGILRTSFQKNPAGEWLAREHEETEASWRSLDWRTLPPAELPQRWAALLEEDSAVPIDLASPPLVRFTAIDLPAGHCHILASFPRFLLDEGFLYPLLSEWLVLMDGGELAPLPEPEETPAASGPAPHQINEWWTRLLAHSQPAVSLPIYPLATGGGAPHQARLPWDRETTDRLRAVCQRLGLGFRETIFAFAELVAGRLGSADKILLLVPESAGQGPGAENLLPFQTEQPAASLTAENWLKARATFGRERTKYAGVSLERVLAVAQPPRRVQDFPLTLSWAPSSLADRIHDTHPRWINCDIQLIRHARFPLELEVRDGERLTLSLTADPGYCPPAEAEKFLRRMAFALEVFLDNPQIRLADLNLLEDSERPGPVAPPSTRSGKLAPARLEDAIAEIAAAQPKQAAVESPDGTVLSYGELAAHARSLSYYLRQENLADGWNIGICLSPTSWIAVALLGVLRANDTCIPLDPEAGGAWLTAQADACDIELMLCDSRTAPLFEGTSRKLLVLDQQWDLVAAAPEPLGSPGAAPKTAFVLVGTPQDVAPPLRALTAELTARACRATERLLDWQPGERTPLLASAGTAAFLEETLFPLTAGATLVVGEPPDLAAIHHLRFTALQWRNWMAELLRQEREIPETLLTLRVEDGPIPAPLFAAWQKMNNGRVRWTRFASPCGFAGLSLRYTVPDRLNVPTELDDIPIGTPSPDLEVRLEDPAGFPLPPHYAGKLRLSISGQPVETHALSSAWRDASGLLHLTDTEPLLTICLREHPAVLDAHSEDTSAWIIVQGSDLDQAGLKATLPTDTGLRTLKVVSAWPLTRGGRLDLGSLPVEAPPAPHVPAAVVPSAAQPVSRTAPALEWDPLVPLREKDGLPLLICVHDLDGKPDRFRVLANQLENEWSVYGTTARGLHRPAACHPTLEAEAASLIEALCALDPAGPYHLFGHGFGAVLAFEMARQLRLARRQVGYLALAGSAAPATEKKGGWLQSLSRKIATVTAKSGTPADTDPVSAAHRRALTEYRVQTQSGPAGIILGADLGADVEEAWQILAPEALIERISCQSADMLNEPAVKRLANILREFAENE